MYCTVYYNHIFFFFQVFIQLEYHLLCWYSTETYLFALTTAIWSGSLREFTSVFHVTPMIIKAKTIWKLSENYLKSIWKITELYNTANKNAVIRNTWLSLNIIVILSNLIDLNICILHYYWNSRIITTMSVSIEQYRARIRSHANFIKHREFESHLNNKFWTGIEEPWI